MGGASCIASNMIEQAHMYRVCRIMDAVPGSLPSTGSAPHVPFTPRRWPSTSASPSPLTENVRDALASACDAVQAMLPLPLSPSGAMAPLASMAQALVPTNRVAFVTTPTPTPRVLLMRAAEGVLLATSHSVETLVITVSLYK